MVAFVFHLKIYVPGMNDQIIQRVLTAMESVERNDGRDEYQRVNGEQYDFGLYAQAHCTSGTIL